MAAQRGVPEPGVLDPGDQFWLEAMADAVLILSPVRGRNQHVSDFRVEYANAATAELADERTADRLRPGGLIGSRFLNLQGPAATAVITAFREVLSSDVPCAIDGLRYRVLRAGAPIDQVRDMRVSRHGDRLLVTLRDVTAREQSEQGVRRSEKSLRALVDGVFDEALMIVDPTGNVLSWNTGAERIFGYTAHRMVGRHYRCCTRVDGRSQVLSRTWTPSGCTRRGRSAETAAASGRASRLLPYMARTTRCAGSSW